MSERKPQKNTKGRRERRDDDRPLSPPTTNDLTQGFDVVVDGRTCGKVVVDWDSIRELGRDGLRNGFAHREKQPVVPTAREDGGRLRRIDHALLSHLRGMLPAKVSAAVGQAINEALTAAMDATVRARGVEVPLARLAEDILKRERQQIKARLGVHSGAPKGRKKPTTPKFKRKEFEGSLNKAIRDLGSDPDSPPTRRAVALRLGVGSAKTLDRLIHYYLPGKNWRAMRSEALGTEK